MSGELSFQAPEDLALRRNQEVRSFELMQLDPENLLEKNNVRPYNPEHIYYLALSILNQGQLNPCIVESNDEGFIIRAGHHRRQAVRLINNWVTEYNSGNHEGILEPTPLETKVFQGPLDDDTVLEIQISENLYHPMTPAEEAEAVYDIYTQAKALGKKYTLKDIARKVGRSEWKVRSSVRFAELNPLVKDLVRGETLQYSLAIDLHQLPHDKQLEAAVKIISLNFTPDQARHYIQNVLAPIDVNHGLFSEAEIREMQEQDYVLSLRQVAGTEMQQATGYFKRLLTLVKSVEDWRRIKITDGIKATLFELVRVNQEFGGELEKLYPELYQELFPET